MVWRGRGGGAERGEGEGGERETETDRDQLHFTREEIKFRHVCMPKSQREEGGEREVGKG